MAKEIKDWITVNHKHIPIYEGESRQDAYNRAVAKANEDTKEKQIAKNKEQVEKLKSNSKRNTAPKKAKIVATHDTKHRQADDFDLKSLGELKDAESVDDFIDANIKNPQFKKFGQQNSMNAIRQLWYKVRQQEEIKDLHEIPIEDAIDKVKDSIRPGLLQGWFRESNSEAKPGIASGIFQNPGCLNAGLNIAYNNYKKELGEGKKALPFKEWLTTPMTLYRGSKGQKYIGSDCFTSYTARKDIALEAAKGNGMINVHNQKGRGKLHTMQVRPIDTWGSYSTNAECEYLVPLGIMEKSKHKDTE